MLLSGYSSILELFAAFNLAYAGINSFSEIINALIYNSFREKYGKIKKQINSQYLSADTVKVLENTDSVAVEIESYKTQIRGLYKKFYETFDDRFRTLYLVCGLYSIFLLLLGGYQQQTGDPECIHGYLFLVTIFIVLYVIIITGLSFRDNYRKVRMAYSLYGFIIVLIVSAIINFLWRDLSNKVSLTWLGFVGIGVVASPFVIHFIRVQSRKLRSDILLNKVIKDFNNKFYKKKAELLEAEVLKMKDSFKK